MYDMEVEEIKELTFQMTLDEEVRLSELMAMDREDQNTASAITAQTGRVSSLHALLENVEWIDEYELYKRNNTDGIIPESSEGERYD